jgi:hypothetical protein
MNRPDDVQQLDKESLLDFVVDVFHRTMIHYGLWFREAEHNLGFAEALELENQVFRASLATQMKRLAKLMGFEVDHKGIPAALRDLSRQELLELAKAQSINWLANDGIWFQAVEAGHGMLDAKRINDTCWVRHSPYEASRIKALLGLSEQAGLEGLKSALAFRTYALINEQSIVEEGPQSFVFQMNECRVQVARKRRGLPDYPCLSVGSVEYPSFAKSLDNRIVTECLGCPPEHHPAEWYCAWRFSLPGA